MQILMTASWLFLIADDVFGHSLEADTAATVKAKGSRVTGSVRHPINRSEKPAVPLQAFLFATTPAFHSLCPAIGSGVPIRPEIFPT